MAAAAYALCGVYRKTNNPLEQLRYSLWLASMSEGGWQSPSQASPISDITGPAPQIDALETVKRQVYM